MRPHERRHAFCQENASAELRQFLETVQGQYEEAHPCHRGKYGRR